MDLLSDVLRVIRLTGSVFFTARLSPPWAFRSPAAAPLARSLGLRTGTLAHFHILVEGACTIRLEGGEPLRLTSGNMIVFPRGDAHVLASREGLEPRPLSVLLERTRGEGVPTVEYGRGPEAALFLCGYLHCDQRFNPLVGALPRLLLAGSGGEVRTERGAYVPPAGGEGEPGWLEGTLRYAVEEARSRRPGSPAMLARLAELLYVEVLRRYSERLPDGETGWLAAVGHRDVGRALRLLHAEPERKWTVEELARAVGLSRSALAESFRRVVGQPPMAYLTAWRMQVAQRLLLDGGLSPGQVARRAGYGSERAFHRAFKRSLGETPVRWREANR